MDPVLNPFRPGAGRTPPYLAGRGDFLDDFATLRRRCEQFGEGDRGWIMSGLRGVGKTALVNELARDAVGATWIVAKVEATAGRTLTGQLARALSIALRTATGIHKRGALRRAAEAVRAFQVRFDPDGAVSVGVEVDLIGPTSAEHLAGDLAELLTDLGTAARNLGIGVLVAVDELQEAARVELAALNAAVHELGQAAVMVPVLFVGAGLPSLPAALSEASSYAERLYDYRTVGLLDRADATRALREPALDHGVQWRQNALTAALREAAGYPYFLQAYGKHIWDAAIRSPISLDDVATGLMTARAEIGDGVYRSRWERASPRQRDLLRAMARLMREGRSHTVRTADLPAALGRNRVSDLSVARNELLRKGLVYAPERGVLAFTVPWMDRFILDEL